VSDIQIRSSDECLVLQQRPVRIFLGQSVELNQFRVTKNLPRPVFRKISEKQG
jgi:hypothetical protein